MAQEISVSDSSRPLRIFFGIAAMLLYAMVSDAAAQQSWDVPPGYTFDTTTTVQLSCTGFLGEGAQAEIVIGEAQGTWNPPSNLNCGTPVPLYASILPSIKNLTPLPFRAGTAVFICLNFDIYIQAPCIELDNNLTSSVFQGHRARVDVKPGVFPNTFDCRPSSGAMVAVSVLSAAFSTGDDNPPAEIAFDVPQFTKIRFGKTGNEAVPASVDVVDLNDDGRMDAILHFRLKDTGFSCKDIPAGQSSVTLLGRFSAESANEIPVFGGDSIRLTNP